MLVAGQVSESSTGRCQSNRSQSVSSSPPPSRPRRVNVMRSSLRLFAALLAAAVLARPAASAPSTWKVDPAHTEVGFEVRHFFSKVHGVFHQMQGTIVYDDQDPSAIQV